MERQERNERARNYSKNVKELYKPGSLRQSKSLRRNTDIGEVAPTDDRKSFLIHDPETGLQKEIRPRMKSGAALKRG